MIKRKTYNAFFITSTKEVIMKSAFVFCFVLALLGCSKCQTTSGVLGPVKTPVAIGTIYGKSSFTNLSDFETSGSTFSVSSGAIQVATDATAAGYIRLPHPTELETFTLTVSYTLTAKGATTGTGLQLNLESVNTTAVVSLKAYLVTETGNANYGKVALVDVFDNLTYYSTTSIALNVGDQIQLILTQNATATPTFQAVNTTLGTAASVTAVAPHNTSKVTIRNLGNSTQTITSINYSSTAIQGGYWGIGDSNTAGAGVSGFSNRYTNLLGMQTAGGYGDKTADLLLREWEAMNITKPAKAYVWIGTNDIGNGVSSTTWQANMLTLYNDLTGAGITVIFLAPPPSNSFSTAGVLTYLATTFPNNYVDTYTPLLGSGTSLNAAYNSGDGIHVNAAGHIVVARTITNSRK